MSRAEVLQVAGEQETELRLQLVAATEKLPPGSYNPEDLCALLFASERLTIATGKRLTRFTIQCPGICRLDRTA